MAVCNASDTQCKKIGNRLKLFRQLLGLSIQDIALETNTEPQEIINHEEGVIVLDVILPLLYTLNKKYGLNINNVICGAGYMFTKKGPKISQEFYKQHPSLFPPNLNTVISVQTQSIGNMTINPDEKEETVSKEKFETIDHLKTNLAINQEYMPIQEQENDVKISVLLNSCQYFIKTVFIMYKKGIFILAAMNNEKILFKKQYHSIRGAKIAFAKIYTTRAWSKEVVQIWSPFYQPELEWLGKYSPIFFNILVAAY